MIVKLGCATVSMCYSKYAWLNADQWQKIIFHALAIYWHLRPSGKKPFSA